MTVLAGSQLAHLSIEELAPLLRAGEVSPVEVVRAQLARIGAHDGRLKSFITVLSEQALAAAAAAEREIARGEWRGPLHGVPIPVKDNFAVQGARTTAGSPLLGDYPAVLDATAVARLREAGAVITGKLNMDELARGATTENPWFGACENPWKAGYVAGGSSGGSAAAVSAGLATASVGTDTGGSVRNPAALCGVVGFKPTYGLISRHGTVPLSWSLDHCGPIAKSVVDVAHLLYALAGYDSKDTASVHAPSKTYRYLPSGDIRGRRVGIPTTWFWDPVEPEVADAVHAAIATLVNLGATTVEVPIPRLDELYLAHTTIALAEPAADHLPTLRSRGGEYSADVAARTWAGLAIPATHYIQALRIRSYFRRVFDHIFEGVDVLVTPTTSITSKPIGTTTVVVGGHTLPVRQALNRCTSLFNILGLPALTVPCGFDTGGLPIGAMLIGPAFADADLLRVGAAYQAVTDWHRRRPPIG
jgi:aspartyl-tRNA(Asn)/glutamyl-tRNA(Gln) amidotransferase subunit A